MERIKTGKKSVSCATSGVGTSPYLSCQLLNLMADGEVLVVPYNGGAPAILSTLSGDTDLVFSNEVLPYITDKRLVGLAVTTPERSSLTPDIPAFSEALPGYDVTSWYGLFAPKGTPEPILERLSAEISKMLEDQSVGQHFNTLGGTPRYRDYKEFADYIDIEVKRWGEILEPMDIRLD